MPASERRSGRKGPAVTTAPRITPTGSQPIRIRQRKQPAALAPAPYLAALATLARLSAVPFGSATALLGQACGLVRDALGANDAYVMRSGDPHFLRVGDGGDPAAYEIAQKGYFLIWRELAANPALAGGLFDVVERRVSNPHALDQAIPATHLALRLPSDESTSELLVVRGPWPSGLTAEQVLFLAAARPILVNLVGILLDTERRQRQREQLQSLSLIAAALTRDTDPIAALPAIATAVAKASGFDWVTITLFDDAVCQVTARVTNRARHSETATAAESREGQTGRDRAVASARYIARTRRPSLYPTLDMPDHEHPLDPDTRLFLDRAHILSTATFPMWSGGRLLGTLNVSSSEQHRFDADEVQFITLLADQASLAVEWLQVHRQLRDANAALARAATHDALTGLPNRVLFQERLAQALARAERRDDRVGVLFIDLDDFKAVNDRLGHDLGDRLLQAVAERLRQAIRTGDLVARMGGDEFTVVLEDLRDEVEAAQAVERIRSAIERPLVLAGHPILPRASIGMTVEPAKQTTAERLLRQADLSMYHVKSGRRTARLSAEV